MNHKRQQRIKEEKEEKRERKRKERKRKRRRERRREAAGVALILTRLYGGSYLSYFLVLLNIPFIYLALRYIRRSFVVHMLIAVLLFAGFLSLFGDFKAFDGDNLEIIVFGGALLGIGVGLIIRYGGCLDGTEILAIIINRKKVLLLDKLCLSLTYLSSLLMAGYLS